MSKGFYKNVCKVQWLHQTNKRMPNNLNSCKNEVIYNRVQGHLKKSIKFRNSLIGKETFHGLKTGPDLLF